jgi:hypothetical protein
MDLQAHQRLSSRIHINVKRRWRRELALSIRSAEYRPERVIFFIDMFRHVEPTYGMRAVTVRQGGLVKKGTSSESLQWP